MKLTEIHVDGFGVWNDLRLRDLSPSVTVLYGPNEAGKTTLMHFLRAMLYGVTAERRERYLPPREGGRPGGSLGLWTEDGPLRVERYVERGDSDRGRVVSTLANGEQQGDRPLRESLESVDEQTYCNVFAIGLDEINELGALEGAEAARWIYRLTSGLDRVSLYDVIRGLGDSRRALVGPAGERSTIADLLAKRDQLNTEIETLAIEGRRWNKLAVEIDEVDLQTEQLQGELREAERKARRIEIGLGLKPLWAERLRVAEERLRYDGLPDPGDNPLGRLDKLNAKAEEHQRQRDVLRGQRRELHQEMKELGVNEALFRSCCRLDALGEQQDWLESLERQSAELGEEVERLDSRVETETARLAKLWRHKPAPEDAPELDEDTLEILRPASEGVHEAERLVAESKRELEALRGHERNYDVQLEGALTSSEKLGLPGDIEEAGELVSLLRRRQKAEQKVDQARRQVKDLAEEHDRLIDRQVLPAELFVLLAAGFATAAVVVFWKTITGTSASPVWWVAAFLGGVGTLVGRYWLEENRSLELDTLLGQREAAGKRVDAAAEELQELDTELPMKEGAVTVRLQHAEKHLQELERMLPVEAERRKASQKTASADEFYRSAKEELSTAQSEWRQALRSVGLPDETTASEVEKLAAQYRSLAEMRSRAENKQEEIDRCEREYEKLSRRIVALAEEADLVLHEAELSEQLEHLLSERRVQQGRIDHRKKLRERAKELKERERKHAAAAERIETELHALFATARAEDEQAFRQVVADLASAARLDEDQARLTREIAAAIGTSGTEADFAELMSRERVVRLDGLWSELTAEHEGLEKTLRELAARRAVLEKERAELIEDTSLADKQVELGLIEAQIDEAKQRWRVRAAIGSMLELIRSDYEEHRQPEVLLEASKYLERFTRGRYPRVWTPLADDVLLVDDADGQSLPVESLSRGTREQLFLSVRMALVAAFARRGVLLPMILDDVLVNFDDHRARVAASVLSKFAAEGHQVLLFTCHEHVRSMFAELGTDVRQLPSRFEINEPLPIAEAVVEPEPAPVEEVIEEVEVVEETLIEEPEPVVVEEPEPLPAYVVAEYETLEPVTETRRVVEQVEVEVDVAPTPEPVAAVSAEDALIEYGSQPSAEIAYGQPIDYPAPPTLDVAYAAPGEVAYGASSGTAASNPAESAYRVASSEEVSETWLDEAQEAWHETAHTPG